MAATSKHWADIKIWIEKVINSCETTMHLHNARHLVRNFENLKILPKEVEFNTINWLRMSIDHRFYYLLEKEREKELKNNS